ncbi:MAG: chromosome partitioning protein ParB, partial [Bacteroidota bacterium]
HGRALTAVEGRKTQLEIYEKIITRSLSVRATEALVKAYQTPKEVSLKQKVEYPEYIKKHLETFATYFSAKVVFNVAKNGRGKLIVPFQSKEDFIRLKKLLKDKK